MEETKKLFSQQAVVLATFLGGPMAGGYLIKKNYNVFAEQNKGTWAFVLSTLFTIFMVGLLVLIPEAIWEKVPNMLLPMAYTLAIYLIVDNTQGSRIKAHKDADGEFYSMWRAAGIGFISLIILAVLIGISIFMTEDFSEFNYDVEKYDSSIEMFYENQDQALVMFSVIDTAQHNESLIQEVEKSTLLWEENKQIVKDLQSIDNLPPELVEQNTMLIEYCNLRILHNGFILKAVREDATDMYISDIMKLGSQIDSLLNKLNAVPVE